ncbi:MAG: sulfurtransferase [Nitrospiraceae bacterium]|nr:sulfurtransferase [Nitrospiraceae bacterium]
MKQALRILVIIFSVTLLSATAYAASHLQHLVDAGWLSQHNKVTVVDVRDRDAYLKGHVPGAVNIPVNDLQSKPDAILLPVRQLEKILGEKGLDINTEVVLYGAGREIAYLEFWMLDYVGMDKLHVLDGGIEQWKGDLSTAETKLASAVFKAKPRPNLYASTSGVKNALRKPHIILLDVRTTGEYKGTDVRSLRGGHIPGATNIDFEENYQDGSTKLKSMDELAKLYGKLDKKKEVIVYCQTGTRAANTFFVLKELGFPKVRNYDASWIEWGSNSSLPADDVSYVNFVSVMKAIKKLEKEVQGQKH